MAWAAWADDGGEREKKNREREQEEELLKHTSRLPYLWNLTPQVQITALPFVLMAWVILLSVLQLLHCIKW